MTRLAALSLFSCTLALAAAPAPESLLHAIENHYNHLQTLKLSFTETYAGSRRPLQTESGVLYLRKPGRMRWEYQTPPGKLFLSDGKQVILYTPDDGHAERTTLKQSEDMRAPLAFLLGNLQFSKEFRSFETHEDARGLWIAAIPKSENLAYTKVEFMATPDGIIHEVHITGQDHSQIGFVFANEQSNPTNPSISDALFAFHPPAGTRIEEVNP